MCPPHFRLPSCCPRALVGDGECGGLRCVLPCLALLQAGEHVSGHGGASGCRLGNCNGCLFPFDLHMAGNPVEQLPIVLGGEALQSPQDGGCEANVVSGVCSLQDQEQQTGVGVKYQGGLVAVVLVLKGVQDSHQSISRAEQWSDVVHVRLSPPPP